MVGSANGRSISEFTIHLPRNSSRTSTQAMIVPSTAFTTTTISEVTSVSFSAAHAWGLDTDVQKPSQPFSVDLATTAASGIRAITLR